MKPDLVQLLKRGLFNVSVYASTHQAALAIQSQGSDERRMEEILDRSVNPMDSMRQTFRKGMRWAASATTDEVEEAISVAFETNRNTL